MPLTGRRVTVTRVTMEKGLAKGPQQVLEITVPLFFCEVGCQQIFTVDER